MRIVLLLAVLLLMWAQIPEVSSDHAGNSTHDTPDSGLSDFHVPLHLILIAGASVLMVLKLFDM